MNDDIANILRSMSPCRPVQPETDLPACDETESSQICPTDSRIVGDQLEVRFFLPHQGSVISGFTIVRPEVHSLILRRYALCLCSDNNYPFRVLSIREQAVDDGQCVTQLDLPAFPRHWSIERGLLVKVWFSGPPDRLAETCDALRLFTIIGFSRALIPDGKLRRNIILQQSSRHRIQGDTKITPRMFGDIKYFELVTSAPLFSIEEHIGGCQLKVRRPDYYAAATYYSLDMPIPSPPSGTYVYMIPCNMNLRSLDFEIVMRSETECTVQLIGSSANQLVFNNGACTLNYSTDWMECALLSLD